MSHHSTLPLPVSLLMTSRRRMPSVGSLKTGLSGLSLALYARQLVVIP